MTTTRLKPFFRLTATDLMCRDLVHLPREMSLRTAAQLLSQARISGAPVVDDNGCCIGVLSATDFVHSLQHRQPPRETAPAACVCADWQVVAAERLPEGEVSRHMSTDVVTVAPTAPIGHLAQMMLDAHIHRLIVVDAQNRPIGIVSSTDIIAAIARASAKELQPAALPPVPAAGSTEQDRLPGVW